MKTRKNNITKLELESKKRSRNLEGLLYGQTRIVLPDNCTKMFAFTADLENGLPMAPVTSIPTRELRKQISALEPEEKEPILLTTRLRDLLPLRSVHLRTGDIPLVQHLEKTYEKGYDGSSTLACVVLSKTGDLESTLILRYDEKSQTWSTKKVGDADRSIDISKHLVSLTKGILNKAYQSALISYTPVNTLFPASKGGGQLSSVISLAWTAIKDGLKPADEIELILCAMRTSSFAATNLLLEQERYFQKCIRQSVGGKVVKYGPRDDIEPQIEMYEDLNKYGVFVFPEVLDKCEDDDRNGWSWYKMPRYTMLSLMDILTSTGGLERFEIETIVRSCCNTLKQTLYERERRRSWPKVTINEYLTTTFVWAKNRFTQVLKEIGKVGEDISAHRPAKVGRNIRMYDSGYFRFLEDYIEFVAVAQKPSVSIEFLTKSEKSIVAEKSELKGITDATPAKCWRLIERSLAKIGRNSIKPPIRKPENIHGDCHFGNFLIDSSIPEKPLIYPIDTDNLKRFVKPLWGISPLYDFAKLHLSCTLAYDIIYKRGIHVEPKKTVKDKKNIWRIDMVLRGEESVEDTEDIGGISPSQIVKLERTITELVVENYKYANSTVHDFCLSWLASNCESDMTYCVCLVRMWLLTVRHGFNSARLLFPRYPDRSFAMLCAAIRFLQAGTGAIAEYLAELQKPEGHREDLESLFRGPFFLRPDTS